MGDDFPETINMSDKLDQTGVVFGVTNAVTCFMRLCPIQFALGLIFKS